MKYYELITTKNVVTAATGAGAIYLLAKTLLAALRSPSFKPEPRDLHRFSVEYHPAPCARATIPGELRRTLQSLKPNLDDSIKKVALHTITQCVFLRESEASSCTYDDIKLVATYLDDADNVIKSEALNALKAFTNIWKFKIKIQEYVPKVIELVVNNWDSSLHAAGLRLVNGLHITEDNHPMLKRVIPNFIDILLMSEILAKVQTLKLLSTMAQKEDLLFDILNCQVPPDFLSLLQPSLPGNLLYEMLVFVKHLIEGRLTPQYQSMDRQYDSFSLHDIVFGENSRLSDHLLALVIHPEEEVQIQACRVILSLNLTKEESRPISSLPFSADVSVHPCVSRSRPNDPAPSSPSFSPRITSTPVSHSIILDASYSSQPLADASHSFQLLRRGNDASHSFCPLENSGHSVVSSQPASNTPNSGPSLPGPMDGFQPVATAHTDEDGNNS